MQMKKLRARDITVLGMMVALNVVMAELLKVAVIPNVLELSLGFLPIAMTGMLFGPLPAALVAVVADVIGALIFYPAYFFLGYTLTALMTGLFYGFFLHKRDASILRIAICQALVSVVCYAGLNSLWVIILYSKSVEYLTTRLVVQPLLYPVYTLVLIVMQRKRHTIEGAILR